MLLQIEGVSLKIKDGLVETKENEEKNAYVLMTMKYLGIILKIVRNSFLEALSCAEALQEEQNYKPIPDDYQEKGGAGMLNVKRADLMYQRSMIAEVDEDSEDEEEGRSKVCFIWYIN